MGNVKLYNRISYEDFLALKKSYESFNDSCEQSMIFHVGTGAGLYSELGSLLECMLYCYVNKIKFLLYADDANFSGGNGWNEFFVDFCGESHASLNKIANYRYKNYHRIGRIALPNMLFKKIILPNRLKKKEGVTYLTQDLFDKFISDDFRESNVTWKLFGINGKVKDEYSKLTSLCLRYNDEVVVQISNLIESLGLPTEYVSIQIRGGDKTAEFTDIIDVKYCLEEIEKHIGVDGNVFVFTDDYRNIEYIKCKRPEWNVYTLTRKDERGYYNDAFNRLDWNIRRKDLIKLFAMVEICIHSNFHIGCNGACVNLYIKSCRNSEMYSEYEIGKHRSNTAFNKLKRIVGI